VRTSHALLLRLKHDPKCHFAKVKVWYADRGAPGDLSSVIGAEIARLDSQYIEVNREGRTTEIPYHRIRKILYAGKVVWEQGVRGDSHTEGVRK
jgi:uncharacterized protein (UPF0248 family)